MATRKKKTARKTARRRKRRDDVHRTTIEIPKEQWAFLERRAKVLTEQMGSPYTPIQALRALLQEQIRREQDAA